MACFSDDALVIDSHPFQDRHLVLGLLTRDHGVIRGVLRNARGGKAPRSAAAQILTLVRVSIYQGPHAELATVDQLELRRSSFPLAQSLEGVGAASAVAELLATFCPVGEPAELPFRLGTAILDALLAEIDPDTAVAYAEYWLLSLSGVLPSLDRCSSCGGPLDRGTRLGSGDGHPRCLACAPTRGEELDSASLLFLESCRHRPVAEIGSPVPPAAGRWLDRLVRAEAHRPLRALDFFRKHRG